MSLNIVIGCLVTILLIGLGFQYRNSKALSIVQILWIWIIMALNIGGMDFQDNAVIYEYSINGAIKFPSGGFISALFAKWLGSHGLVYWQYNAIMITIALFIFYIAIRKNTDRISLYLALFMIFPFAESVIQKRWFLMMVFAFVAFIYISKEEYIHAAIYFLIALGFHESVIMLIPIILLDKIIDKSIWVMRIAFLCELFLLTGGQNFLISIFGKYSGKFIHYYIDAHISRLASACYIILCITFIVLMLSIQRKGFHINFKPSRNMDFISRINIFSTIYIPFLLADSVFFRNYRITMLFNFFALSESLGKISIVKGKRELYSWIYVLAMVAYVIVGYSFDKAGLIGPLDTMFNNNMVLRLAG